MAWPPCMENFPPRAVGRGGGAGAAVSASAGRVRDMTARAAKRCFCMLFSISGSAHHALVQACDGVERRGHRPFLPGRNARGMLSSKDDAPIERAEIVIVFGAAGIGPGAGAAQGEGHPV